MSVYRPPAKAVLSLVLNASGQPVSKSMNGIIYRDPLVAFFRGPMKSHWTTCHGLVGASHDLASALYLGARFLKEQPSHALTYAIISVRIYPQ